MSKFRTLADLATEDWRFQLVPDCNEVEFVRPDYERRGCYVGPLVRMALGATCDDGEGNDAADLAGEDGRNLYVIALLPEFARLVTWGLDELGRLNAIHFDQNTEAGRFNVRLRSRLEVLRAAVDARPAIVTPGMHGMGKP